MVAPGTVSTAPATRGAGPGPQANVAGRSTKARQPTIPAGARAGSQSPGAGAARGTSASASNSTKWVPRPDSDSIASQPGAPSPTTIRRLVSPLRSAVPDCQLSPS